MILENDERNEEKAQEIKDQEVSTKGREISEENIDTRVSLKKDEEAQEETEKETGKYIGSEIKAEDADKCEELKEEAKTEGKKSEKSEEPSKNEGFSYEFNHEESKTGSYNPGTVYYVDDEAAKSSKQGGDLPGWAKFLIIFASIIVGLMILISSCTSKIENALDDAMDEIYQNVGITSEMTGNVASKVGFDHDYIGVLHIESTISEDGKSSDYNHDYLLGAIDDMIDDDHNKGIILYLDTPGGSVYASDEMYFKIKEYQEKTKRPVYSSMQSMCASGGYYISAPCDKIVANRNCWTGSIGVVMSSIYDVSELLEKYGVHVVTIASGDNKTMGNSFEPLTKEQKEILQTIVDEAYEQFVDIVAEGRDMSVKDVKKLADGRIYTALQAKENGLIDEVGTYEDCIEMMKKDFRLDENIAVEDLKAPTDTDVMSLLGITSSLQKAGDIVGSMGDVLTKTEIEELADMNGKIDISYMSTMTK